MPPPVQPGRLVLAGEVGPGSWRLGPFEVVLSDARLVVRHPAAPGGVALASPAPGAFAAAVRGEVRFTGLAGHLGIDEQVRQRLADQVLETVVQEGGVLRFGGHFAGPWEGRDSPYSVAFRCVDDETLEVALRLVGPGARAAPLAVEQGATGADVPAPGPWAELLWERRRGSAVFGGGVQFSHLDMSGRRLPMLTVEQGVGRGAQPLTLLAELYGGAGGQWWSTYAPAPVLYTSEPRGLYLVDSYPMQLDLRHPSVASARVYAPQATARVIVGSTPAELIEAYTRHAGRMAPLPGWADRGAILGLQGGSDKVRSVVGALERHGAPLAGVWLQDWVGNRTVGFGQRLWWDWQLNRDRYPDWDALVDWLEGKGLSALVYVNPFLAEMSLRPGGRPDLFTVGKAQGRFVRTRAGDVYMTDQGDFEAGLVDLSDSEAVAWYLETLTDKLAETRAHGWMADFGEGLPFDALLADGVAHEWHNRYPEAWATFNRRLRERLAERLGRRPEDFLTFFRSGYMGSPRDAGLFWLGDQTVTWDEHDGLRSALTGLLSSGFAGYSLQHGDVGGYTSTVYPLPRRVRSRELLARWGELMAFTAVLRTHEGNRPRLNLQVYSNEQTLADFARAARLHGAWRGLRRELMAEAADRGLP
ncbi:MAG TPA: TIM-barrel domain-containing protein, partial [Trueperaceae bacterium]